VSERLPDGKMATSPASAGSPTPGPPCSAAAPSRRSPHGSPRPPTPTHPGTSPCQSASRRTQNRGCSGTTSASRLSRPSRPTWTGAGSAISSWGGTWPLRAGSMPTATRSGHGDSWSRRAPGMRRSSCRPRPTCPAPTRSGAGRSATAGKCD
jgi:hypothetical protein